MSIYPFRGLNSTTLQYTNQCWWPYSTDYRIKSTFMSTRPFQVEPVIKKFEEELVLKLTIHYKEVSKQICSFLFWSPIFHFLLIPSANSSGTRGKWGVIVVPHEHSAPTFNSKGTSPLRPSPSLLATSWPSL